MFGKVTWLALLLFLTACSSAASSPTPAGATAPSPAETRTAAETVRPAETPIATGITEPVTIMTEDDRPSQLRAITADWNTNWNRHTIDYAEILSGGPPRDGIPSIDEPVFITPEEAAEWLAGNEPVMVLTLNDETRAYPLQILTWHEIVNDTVGGVPVVVTYCPLCNSAIAFERQVEGDVYEFGTSGLLRHSDLIMYDRTTESLWQQLTGEAIVGDLAGKQLAFIPASIVSFEDFQAAYPDGLVLSRETGYSRRYGQNPYVGYDSPFLFQGEPDGRLPAMERVVTIALNGVDVAYPLSALAEAGVINDRQGGQAVVVFYAAGTSSALDAVTIAEGADVGATGVFDPHLDGQQLTFQSEDGRIVDEQTSSQWNILGQATAGPLAGQSLIPLVHGDHFWFAWAAFKADTIIYQNP
jgi:hypothetical protein